MKKLIYFALASATTLQLAGCGVTDPIVLDTFNMGDGFTAKTALGGYWWTFVDRSGTSFVDPNTGKQEPTNPKATALRAGIALGNGIDEINGNLAYHVRGYVGPQPNYTAANKDYTKYGDPYWDAIYGSICKGGFCGEIKYPASGIGWGFKDRNVPLGKDALDAAGKPARGVAFKIMLGAEHGNDPATNVDPAKLYVAAAMDITDVPDPSFNDSFGTAYDKATAETAGLPTSPNRPFCTFPNSPIDAKGVNVAGGNKTCFGNFKVALEPQPVKGAFTAYCVAFNAFEKPAFGNITTAKNSLKTAIPNVIPERLIKIQFDAYQPLEAEPTTAYDFYVDDAMLLTEEKWNEVCTGTTKLMVGAAAAGG